METDQIEWLQKKSLEVILQHQHPSGAFIASPNFSQYGFSWMRDGSFIAYGLLVSGESDAVARFLNWAFNTVGRYTYKIDLLADWQADGVELMGLDKHRFLPARFTLDGFEDTSSWPNFQIDGYGSLLWLTAEYLKTVQAAALPASWRPVVEQIIRYLKLVWRLPNSDCWEENPDKIHPATLGCIYGGLQAISNWIDSGQPERTAQEVRDFVLGHLHKDGRFPKFIGGESVDASLLWLSLPFGMVSPQDEVMRQTVEYMEATILGKGGVKRYPEDTYFGGGEWIILTAWLAWFYLRTGNQKGAESLIEWIVRSATEDGFLPEQILNSTNDPSMISPWVEEWGSVAEPLLWSHGMYLVVIREWYNFLDEKGE